MGKAIKLYIRNFFLDMESLCYFIYGLGMFLTKAFDTRNVSIIPTRLYLKLFIVSWILFLIKEVVTSQKVARRLEKKGRLQRVLITYILGTSFTFTYFFLGFQNSATAPLEDIYRYATIIAFLGICLGFVFSICRGKRDASCA